MSLFKDQLLQHYETEYNLLEAAQGVLKDWEERGDGSVDFRRIEILEAWCILSRASFEELAEQKAQIDAAERADKDAIEGYEERSAMMRKTLLKNLGKEKKPRVAKYSQCLTCGTPLTGKQRKFCSHKCGVDHHNRKRHD
jgi:hypothetical protein